MQFKSLKRIIMVLLSVMAVLSAAEQIVPAENGYFYTDSLYSRIYFTDLRDQTLCLEGPGVGRFYSLSNDEKYIGFKYRDEAGGLEAPALYHIADRKVELLHSPVYCAGQVSFSNDGAIAYTIDDQLYIKRGDNLISYDLGSYSNLAPISPDGKYVVYNDLDDQLWLLDLDSEEKNKITGSDIGHALPAWSGDSRYISYSTLDGSIGIYDLSAAKTLDLGPASRLVWSRDRDVYSYLAVSLNEDSSDIRTDAVVAAMSSGTLNLTATGDVNEVAAFFTKDGSVLSLNEDNEIKLVHSTGLKKVNTDHMLFPTDPVTFVTLAPTVSYLDVPYVHQVYDTPGPRGYSSCAPTTAAMVLAYYGILPKWPFLSGFNNWSDYGAYVHEKYYYRENYFDLKYRDCNSAQTSCYDDFGGMGYMWTGGSPNSRMAGYYNKHGVSTNQTWSTSWSTVAAEIDKKQPFSICNYLSSSGHLIVAKGRTDNGQRTVIVNDPYGDRNQYTWPNYSGKTVQYDWPGYNHGHASLNYANSGYTAMPWCIATNYTAPAVVDSIVDDRNYDHGFYIKAQGNTVPMRYYRSKKSGFGGHHWWTYTEAGGDDVCYVTWTPQVESGYYEIKAYIPANANASTAVYRIHHAAGVERIVIDQSAYSDTLISLGKYLMADDGSNYVYLGDSTAVSGEILAFDAMVWETAEQQEMDFVSDHTNGYPAYPVNFQTISTLPVGDYEYIWDFGDGTFGYGDSVAHAYADTGTFTVSLTVEANGVSIVKTHLDLISIKSNTFMGTEIQTIFPDSMETVNNPRPTLVWEDQGQLTVLKISETPEFDTPNITVSTTTNMYTLDQDLSENKTYYWTLETGDNSSKIWAFRVNAENSLPQPFDLGFPENGFVSDTLRPRFEWSSTGDADPGDEVTYKLYIGTHEDSMTCVYAGPQTEYQIGEDLSENSYYIWYVDAVDKSKASRRSSDASRVVAINAVNEAPQTPSLIAPNHNSYQTTRYPYFEWTSVQDPDPGDRVSYKLFYWTAASTSPHVITTTGNYYDSRRFSDLREYFWCVAAVDEQDIHSYSDTSVFYTNTQLDVVDIPDEFSLEANYPNPFNPITTISYGLPEAADVKLDIFDMNGRCVATLVNATQSSGRYSIHFDAHGLSSGIYMYRIVAGDFIDSKKMLLMK